MSNKENTRYVVPNPDGGWDVKKSHAGRTSAHFDRQADAQQRATEIVHNLGGGEVQIHGRNNKIRNSNTIAPAKDPFPPRDKKH